MKIVKPLSPAQANSAKPKKKPYKLFDGGGLYLEVLPGGSKSWRLKYRWNGKDDCITIGQYPEIGLAEARERRQELRALIASGINPRDEKKRQQAEDAAIEARKKQTFRNIAQEFFERQNWAANYGCKVIAQVEKLAYPAFGDKHVSEVSRQDILAVARALEKLGTLDSAKRFIQRVGQILRHALDMGIIQSDPTVNLARAIASPRVKHMSYLKDKARIGQFLRACESYGGYPQTRAALMLAPMLLLRPGELLNLEWRNLDWHAREIHIPPEKMKMRRKHIVPLSRQALSLLENLKALFGRGDNVFPSARAGVKHLTIEGLTVALRSMGFTPEELHMHGLRAMAATMLNERGFNADWIERQLAHADKNKIRDIYNHAEYLAQRHELMQAWSDYLDELKAQAGG